MHGPCLGAVTPASVFLSAKMAVNWTRLRAPAAAQRMTTMASQARTVPIPSVNVSVGPDRPVHLQPLHDLARRETFVEGSRRQIIARTPRFVATGMRVGSVARS